MERRATGLYLATLDEKSPLAHIISENKDLSGRRVLAGLRFSTTIPR